MIVKPTILKTDDTAQTVWNIRTINKSHIYKVTTLRNADSSVIQLIFLLAELVGQGRLKVHQLMNMRSMSVGGTQHRYRVTWGKYFRTKRYRKTGPVFELLHGIQKIKPNWSFKLNINFQNSSKNIIQNLIKTLFIATNHKHSDCSLQLIINHGK